tara:strand:+ start:7615 stop:7866 length:252 start_codon:yes stop_codon:yes gene_type:complete
MAQKNKNNKQDQFLIGFVKDLQKLNKVKIKVPKKNIADVLDNPREYAINFIESSFVQYIPRYIKAHKLGQKFGKDLVENNSKD